MAWGSSKSPKFDRAEAVKNGMTVKGDRTIYKAIFAKAQANGWKKIHRAKESIIDAAFNSTRSPCKWWCRRDVWWCLKLKPLTTLYTSSKVNYARTPWDYKTEPLNQATLRHWLPEREEEQSTTERLFDIAKEQCEFFTIKTKSLMPYLIAHGAPMLPPAKQRI